ncbi:GNAT family N-acetyltransferase [Nonomuraea sp. NPDC049400]|uniref:GNAT family N-acetyltransferase n=1 Tax=Nonomuraea sp. NPDC049400 TaxID=3364352 RepID=UPI0037A7FEF9
MSIRMAGLTSDQSDVRALPYDHPDALALVHALYDDQMERYGYADPAEAPPALFVPPQGLFLVSYVDDVPAACGGFRTYAPRAATVEIKKMYTAPPHRGRGLGQRLLETLERAAVEHGAQWAILETGVRNTAALALYDRLGYQPTDRYIPGRDPAINRAFIKDLTHASG